MSRYQNRHSFSPHPIIPGHYPTTSGCISSMPNIPMAITASTLPSLLPIQAVTLTTIQGVITKRPIPIIRNKIRVPARLYPLLGFSISTVLKAIH